MLTVARDKHGNLPNQGGQITVRGSAKYKFQIECQSNSIHSPSPPSPAGSVSNISPLPSLYSLVKKVNIIFKCLAQTHSIQKLRLLICGMETYILSICQQALQLTSHLLSFQQTLANRLYGVMAWSIPVLVACSTFGTANGGCFSGGRQEKEVSVVV